MCFFFLANDLELLALSAAQLRSPAAGPKGDHRSAGADAARSEVPHQGAALEKKNGFLIK